MSDDIEARLLDMEFRFAGFLTNISDKFSEINLATIEMNAETFAIINIILHELIADGVLDRDRLIVAMETHSERVTSGGRFGTRRVAVENLLTNLRRAHEPPARALPDEVDTGSSSGSASKQKSRDVARPNVVGRGSRNERSKSH